MKRPALAPPPTSSSFALRILFAVMLASAGEHADVTGQAQAGGIDGARARDLPARSPMDALPAAARADAARAYARAERAPRDAAAAGEVALLLHAHDQLEPARQWYEHARRLDPASFDWAYGAGLTGILAGRHAEAVVALRDAVRLDNRAVTARLRFGEALLALGDATEASAVAKALAADFPSLAQAHYLLGRAAAAIGDQRAAVGHYREAIGLFSGYGAAHYGLALALRDLGDAAAAAAALARYEQHRMDTPQLPDALLDAVDARGRGAARHLASGVALANAGRVDEAIRELNKALVLDAQLVQAHVHLIALHAGKGDTAAAEKHYRAALASNSHLADAHYNYGVLLMNQKRVREAGDAFRHALEVNPHQALARNNLGQALESEHHVKEAADEYRLAVEADPLFRVARFNLGRMLVALGRLAEAIEQLRRTLEPVDGSTPTYMYALAAAYVRAGDRENALRYGQEAHRQASELGQYALAATIARDLEKLKK